MRWTSVTVLAAALALTGCGGNEQGEEAAGARVTAASGDDGAGAAVKPLPGQYRMRLELVKADIPGAPAGASDLMRQSIAGQTHEFCLTPEQAERSFTEMAKQSQDGQCTTESERVNGSSFVAVVNCKTPTGAMRIAMEGTGEATRSQITMTMTGDIPGMGPDGMQMRMNSERVGDCPA